MYFTDRGIEELQTRRGEDEVTLAWLADQLRTFVDLYPEFETRWSGSRPGSPAWTRRTSRLRSRQGCCAEELVRDDINIGEAPAVSGHLSA